ncbi:hypothetical protein OESDEN_11404 [Oesophagostomum dentatum]|uniref:MULE transposase domain-containing protein n=1 Tax=Oesophagostomum dentatum TaxID=61180 RepID=A0A0B1SU00_OESDE|nr:hypothetical protein OESDEN_11404 [Oesophagostomum dentatum]
MHPIILISGTTLDRGLPIKDFERWRRRLRIFVGEDEQRRRHVPVYLMQESQGMEIIKVIGDDFQYNPCAMDHQCTPVNYSKDKGNRLAYKLVGDIKSDRYYAGKAPRHIYEEKLAETDELYDGEVVMAFYGDGFEQRRRTIRRAVNSLKDHAVDNVPDELALLRDGTRFKACDNGLYTLVADGVHTKQPKTLVQLYCIHVVYGGGIEVPLVYALTARKLEETYETIFTHLQNLLLRYRPRPMQRLRVVLELPAINAAKRVFTDSIVQGCAFHLSQAWNRQRDKCRITDYIQGETRDERVEEWWDTIKGVFFLPERLRRGVGALHNPPAPEDHPAHPGCLQFLHYLWSTWFEGPFAELWCKWELTELRTTNLAEAYHSRLNTTFPTDHPDMRTLLEKLRAINLEAVCTLQWLENNPGREKRLRRRD